MVFLYPSNEQLEFKYFLNTIYNNTKEKRKGRKEILAKLCHSKNSYIETLTLSNAEWDCAGGYGL